MANVNYDESVPRYQTTPARPPASFIGEATQDLTRPPVKEDATVPGLWLVYGWLLMWLVAATAGVALCRLLRMPPDLLLIALVATVAASLSMQRTWAWFTTTIWEELAAFRTHQWVKGMPPVRPLLSGPGREDVIRVELHDTTGGGNSTQIARLPACMAEIARGLVVGRPFAEEEWCGRDRPLSVAKFRDLRYNMMDRGWLVWKNEQEHSQGTKFTKTGWRVIVYLAEMGTQVLEPPDAQPALPAPPDSGEATVDDEEDEFA